MALHITRRTLLTWPNAVSIVGFTLVLAGTLHLDTWAGFGLVVAGRLADMADGRLARSTHHTSRFGALLDATLDKLAVLAMIIAMWAHAMAPAWILLVIVLQNVINTLATAVAEQSHPGRNLKPSRSGKYAMAVQNLALASFVISYLISPPFDLAAGELPDQNKMTPEMLNLSDGFYWLGLLATIVGVGVLGLMATAYYIRRIRR